MKVQTTNAPSTLMTDYTFTKVKNNKQEVWNQDDEKGKPVQVTISEEGIDCLRNSILETEGYQSQTYDKMSKIKGIMSKFTMDLSGTYSQEMISADSNSKNQTDDGSIKDKIYKSAYNYLEYYANKYDEIAKGYDDGTKELWVFDQNSELGFRKLTKEEDLDALDKAYERNAEIAATFAITVPVAQKAIQDSLTQLAQVRVVKLRKEDTIEEEPIENLYEKMMESRNTFKNSYSTFTMQDKKHQNISALVKQIFSNRFAN